MKLNDNQKQIPEVQKAASREEVLWLNPNKRLYEEVKDSFSVTSEEMKEAEALMQRFAPYLAAVFPETREAGGIVESPLRAIPEMEKCLRSQYRMPEGQWLMKLDSELPVAGSVKARGGIYEVLQYTEKLAFEKGMLSAEDDYSVLAEPKFRDFFGQYTIQVGSTGNLGLSIGIISAKLGFKVIVHMSADAKEWKKELLREKGVTVVEYNDDYSKAVQEGRRRSQSDPMSYFVDDENSRSLFLGYTVAGERVRRQLEEQHIPVDAEHPLFVYLPCGIGGAPGGIAFGLKHAFGDAVHCFFTEPADSCCMLLGMATGLHDGISVQDIGLSGKTMADGLAVGRPSAFVGRIMEPLLSGIATVQDAQLFQWMRSLLISEEIFIEPSSCAAFAPVQLGKDMERYIEKEHLRPFMKNAHHLAWATGGRLVPQEERELYIRLY